MSHQNYLLHLKKAEETKGRPTVILAKTVKGYGMGEAAEGKNIAHQVKKNGYVACCTFTFTPWS